jgi:branched-chain amino acid transport system permease protein
VNFRSVPPLISDNSVFAVGGVHYSWQALFVILVTAPVLVLLTWLVKSTRQGKAMRATSQDPEASAMMGINVNRTISFTFLLAGALAGVGAVLFLVEFNVRYDTGFELGLIAFTAAVLGGIGNLTGAVLGAVLIGLIQAFNEGLSWFAPGSDWTRSIVFGLLIAILVFRPEGLLGERTPEGA